MFEEEIKFQAKLTYKAKQGEREYEQILRYEQRNKNAQQVEIDVNALEYSIVLDKKNYYLNIFLKNLERAVEETKEYNRLNIYSDNIVNILTWNIMEFLNSIIEYGAYGIYDTMNEKAGDMSDFWEGVENARELIGTSGKDKERAARYWANKVWVDSEMYKDTIGYRFQVWEDKAPYWNFLEHGNFFQARAFPRFTQTLFLSHSAYEILDDIEIEVAERKEAAQEDTEEIEEINEQFDKEELNLFNKAVKDLEENPDKYQPGDIFNTYISMENNREYKIYLTKTGKIGRRLVR
jgi:hypothetical protein